MQIGRGVRYGIVTLFIHGIFFRYIYIQVQKIYLPTHLPIYLPASHLLPSPPARPRAGVPTSASHTLPKAFFLPSPRPKPSQNQAAILFFFFPFFMLIRRDSNPSPLCLPIHYQFNAYANCAIPARLQIQWFFCMLFICKSNSCP